MSLFVNDSVKKFHCKKIFINGTKLTKDLDKFIYWKFYHNSSRFIELFILHFFVLLEK